MILGLTTTLGRLMWWPTLEVKDREAVHFPDHRN
jgi:hypothetical protein